MQGQCLAIGEHQRKFIRYFLAAACSTAAENRTRWQLQSAHTKSRRWTSVHATLRILQGENGRIMERLRIGIIRMSIFFLEEG
jgi:hypothetical protein